MLRTTLTRAARYTTSALLRPSMAIRVAAPINNANAIKLHSYILRTSQPLSAARFYTTGNKLTNQDILSRINKIVSGFNSELRDKKISADTKYSSDLNLDSLDTVELLVAIEEEFDIEIPDDVADGLTSVGSTIDYVLGNPEAH